MTNWENAVRLLYRTKSVGNARKAGQEAQMELMTCDEAADYLRVSKGTLASARYAGVGGPPYVRVGAKAVRYDRARIDEWLKGQERTSTAA